MKTTITPVKGTRDFYPEDIAIRVWLYNLIRKVAESFGYQEYDGPFLEKLELYAAKSGEELVKEQAFVFPDRGGEMIALRPELTPSLARMVAQRQDSLIFPLRWWSFGPFWRYERPQKGRSREFFQWNIDLIGPNLPEADAEIAAIAIEFFKVVGLSEQQISLHVNSRKLMDERLRMLGVPTEKHSAVFHLIDRREKMKAGDWDAYGQEIGLSMAQMDGLKSLLADEKLWEQSDELRRFFRALEALGVREYARYDPQIIRGLDYYTGIVYEARDEAGEFRAVLGGGRYDNLVADVGGEPVAATGFAMGDVVITLMLRQYGLIPAFTASPAQVMVTVFDEELHHQAISFSAYLRSAGLNVNCFPEPARLPKQLRYADRMGIRLAVILGPDEISSGCVTIKDLQRGEQVTVSRSEAAEKIRTMLS